MNSHFCLYLLFLFSLQDEELLYYSSPYAGIATLGCFPSRKVYFDSWHSPDTTNNVEAAELYTPSKPKRRTETDPCVHRGANHSTFHSHFFSSSSNLTPPILYVCAVVQPTAWERQCCLLPKAWHPAVRDWGPPVSARDSEGLWTLDLGCNIFLLTISELHNGQGKGMPISFERNWGSERKPFALEDITATTLDRMEPNNTDRNELTTNDPVLTVVHPGCTLTVPKPSLGSVHLQFLYGLI